VIAGGLCEDERAEEAYRQTLELHPDLTGRLGGPYVTCGLLKRQLRWGDGALVKDEKNFSHLISSADGAHSISFAYFGGSKEIYAELRPQRFTGRGHLRRD